MKWFHKEIYFPDTVKLKELTARLNSKNDNHETLTQELHQQEEAIWVKKN